MELSGLEFGALLLIAVQSPDNSPFGCLHKLEDLIALIRNRKIVFDVFHCLGIIISPMVYNAVNFLYLVYLPGGESKEISVKLCNVPEEALKKLVATWVAEVYYEAEKEIDVEGLSEMLTEVIALRVIYQLRS